MSATVSVYGPPRLGLNRRHVRLGHRCNRRPVARISKGGGLFEGKADLKPKGGGGGLIGGKSGPLYYALWSLWPGGGQRRSQVSLVGGG